MHRRRLLLCAAALPLAGCAGLGGPRSLVLGEAELQARLAAQFPQQRRLLELFDVTLSAPRLRLRPEQNRVASELELELRERLGGQRLNAQIAFDSALRFEPSDSSLRLAQVRVERLAAGTDSTLPLPRIASLLAEQLLEDLAVWRASPEQAQRLQRAGVQTVRVQITPRGLELQPQSAR